MSSGLNLNDSRATANAQLLELERRVTARTEQASRNAVPVSPETAQKMPADVNRGKTTASETAPFTAPGTASETAMPTAFGTAKGRHHLRHLNMKVSTARSRPSESSSQERRSRHPLENPAARLQGYWKDLILTLLKMKPTQF